MKGVISIIILVVNAIAVFCKPTDVEKLRNKRQYAFGNYGEDSYLMRELWDQPVGLGFFVNPKPDASDDGDSRRTVRDKISEISEGSGSLETKRDEILEKPTSTTVFAAEKPISSNAEETEITGELKSTIEKKPEKNQTKREDTIDPGEKKKIRSSVTCQGQKEWIQCDGPYELIRMKEAFWGRDDENTCAKSDVTHGLKTDRNCTQDGDNVMAKVKEACDNENVCEVVASDIYFDKTDCPDVYKFLKLKWQCAPSESRIKETN